MERELFRQIKHLSIIALFSDNDLLDKLVLKGGTALEFYDIDHRFSLDLDFSIDNEFEQDLGTFRDKIANLLNDSFKEAGYIVFDVKLRERPQRVSSDMLDFWGGYLIEFKVIEVVKYFKLSDNIDSLRRNATVIGPKNKRTFRIEISKYEYCEQKQVNELSGYTFYIYPPSMLICEKLRAICQQTLEYGQIVRSSSQTARARDFYDIYLLMERYQINLISDENIDLLKKIFDAKRVPLSFIAKIQDYRGFHRQDFLAVRGTVGANIYLHNFDFYFDYILNQCEGILNTLRIV
jgi:predicted nucleotidyltransferase component of viral defense system